MIWIMVEGDSQHRMDRGFENSSNLTQVALDDSVLEVSNVVVYIFSFFG